MISLKLLKIAEPKPGTLQALKQYAAVPDSTRDALLASLLKNAILKVQEAADKTLIPCTLEVTMSQREENGPVRLYQTISEIETVTDGKGNTLQYARNGNEITPAFFTDTVVVRYTTQPEAGTIAELEPVVFQYATALYDGETTETLNKILLQC